MWLWCLNANMPVSNAILTFHSHKNKWQCWRSRCHQWILHEFLSHELLSSRRKLFVGEIKNKNLVCEYIDFSCLVTIQHDPKENSRKIVIKFLSFGLERCSIFLPPTSLPSPHFKCSLKFLFRSQFSFLFRGARKALVWMLQIDLRTKRKMRWLLLGKFRSFIWYRLKCYSHGITTKRNLVFLSMRNEKCFRKTFFVRANKTLMKSIMWAWLESIETWKANEIKLIDSSRWKFVYRIEEAILASSEQIERKNIDGVSPQDINLYWFMLIDEFLFQIIASPAFDCH